MQNKFSMRHKPVTEIERKCKSLKRIHEVVLTMPIPVVNVLRYQNHLFISARNLYGVCIYKYDGAIHPTLDDNLIKDLRKYASSV